MKIELFVNTDKGKVFSNKQVCGSIQHYVRDVFIGLSDKEKEMKEQLERIAKENKFELEIYDVRKRRNRLLAQSKGVRKTPAVIIGSHKFEEDFVMNDIMKSLGIEKITSGHKEDFKKYICPRCRSPDIKIYDDSSGYCNECNEAFMSGVAGS